MPKLIDLTGQRFGSFTVIKRGPRKGAKSLEIYWECKCDCGTRMLVRGGSLRWGQSKSCGIGKCAANFKHGHSANDKISSTYNAWNSMQTRCTNPSAKYFERYGGRNITVCKRWGTFKEFLADMGEKPKGKSLDRIDNEGNYEPSNCRWATLQEQAGNQSTSRRYTFLGQTCCISEWARRSGVSRNVLLHRLNKGWPIEKAVTEIIRG